MTFKVGMPVVVKVGREKSIHGWQHDLIPGRIYRIVGVNRVSATSNGLTLDDGKDLKYIYVDDRIELVNDITELEKAVWGIE